MRVAELMLNWGVPYPVPPVALADHRHIPNLDGYELCVWSQACQQPFHASCRVHHVKCDAFEAVLFWCSQLVCHFEAVTLSCVLMEGCLWLLTCKSLRLYPLSNHLQVFEGQRGMLVCTHVLCSASDFHEESQLQLPHSQCSGSKLVHCCLQRVAGRLSSKFFGWTIWRM